MICTVYDLDFFKQVNDELGHDAGDEILLSFTEVIKKTLRAGEKAFRYGGEEFITISLHKDGSQAEVLANRIRLTMEKKKKHHGITRAVTCSAGVAVATSSHMLLDAAAFVSCADKALYEAKEGGRNRVCLYSENK